MTFNTSQQRDLALIREQLSEITELLRVIAENTTKTNARRRKTDA